MANLNRLFVALMFIAALFSGEARSAEPAFSLNIKLASDVIKAGSDVTVTVVLANVSDQPQSLGWGEPDEGNFTLDVRDASGIQAGKTRLYRALTGDHTGKDALEPPLPAGTEQVMVGKFTTITLPPGKTQTYNAVVNKLYDLSQPGKYSIVASKVVDSSGSVVRSNTVILTVVADAK